MFVKDEKETLQNIAQIFKSIRKIKDFTQSDLAEVLGVSQSYLSKIEGGTMMPSAHHWMVFCEYFCVSPNSLFSGVIEHFDNEADAIQAIGPKKYIMGRSVCVRFIRPICLDLKNNYNLRKCNEFFKMFGMSSSTCILLNYSFGPQFFHEFFLAYKNSEIYKLDKYAPRNPNDLFEIHGELVNEYLKSSDVFGLAEIFFQNFDKYDSQVKVLSFIKDGNHCEIELDLSHYKQLTDNVMDFYGRILVRHLEGLQQVLFHNSDMAIKKTYNEDNQLFKLSLSTN